MSREPEEPAANTNEIVMANAALLRTLIVFLMFKNQINDDELDILFDMAKDQLIHDDPGGIRGAISFLDYQRQTIAIGDEARADEPGSVN